MTAPTVPEESPVTVRRRVVTRLLTAAAGLVTAVPLAVSTPADAGAAAPAFVRAALLSPDTPKVDVYLTALSGGSTRLWLSSVGYGDVSAYRRMPAGRYAVSMRPHGAKASTPAALRWTLTLRPDASYTAAAVGEQSDVHGIVVQDSLRSPGRGRAAVRVVQADGSAPRVAVSVAGRIVAPDVRFGTVSRYVTVPSGTLTVRVRALGVGAARSLRFAAGAGSVTSVLVLDRRGGGVALRPLTDANGTRQASAGSLPAGAGGTARPLDADGGPLALLALGLLVGGVLFFRGIAAVRRPVRRPGRRPSARDRTRSCA
ncbi:DUF4397 domain-containing protein [Jatrophihabitans fulvus]